MSMSALVLVRHSARTFSTAARARVLCPAGLRRPGHENRMLGKSEGKGEESNALGYFCKGVFTLKMSVPSMSVLGQV